MYEAIKDRDIVDIMSPLIKEGWYIDSDTKKYTRMPAISPDAPWIYVNPRPDLHCYFDRNLFDVVGFIPRRCRNCFKVVIRPKTVAQLIRLYELMDTEFKEQGIYCKCGIEERNYVFGNYGGYCYSQGLSEGKKSYRMITDILNKNRQTTATEKDLSMDMIRVILKRGCTEMELKTGPSKQYVVPYWADELEDKIMDVVDLAEKRAGTPKFIADHTIRKWLEFAWDRGDKTCLEFSDGTPIFPNKIDTYHEEV